MTQSHKGVVVGYFLCMCRTQRDAYGSPSTLSTVQPISENHRRIGAAVGQLCPHQSAGGVEAVVGHQLQGLLLSHDHSEATSGLVLQDLDISRATLLPFRTHHTVQTGAPGAHKTEQRAGRGHDTHTGFIITGTQRARKHSARPRRQYRREKLRERLRKARQAR